MRRVSIVKAKSLGDSGHPELNATLPLFRPGDARLSFLL